MRWLRALSDLALDTSRQELCISVPTPKSLMFGCIMNGLRNGKGEESPIQHLSLDTIQAISLPEVKYQKPALNSIKITANSHQHHDCLFFRTWKSIILSAVLWYLIKEWMIFFIKRLDNFQVYGGVQKTFSLCPVKETEPSACLQNPSDCVRGNIQNEVRTLLVVSLSNSRKQDTPPNQTCETKQT